MKTVYVTILTHGFEVQALTLARSIVQKSPDADFYLFCLDEAAEKNLQYVLPERSKVIPYDAIRNDVLDRLKKERPPSSFCWTCKPFVIDYTLSRVQKVDWVVYLDCDMMALANPNERLAQAANCSVILTPHAFRYHPFIGTETLVGTFNAAYFGLRNTKKGREILSWWFEKCIKHCPNIPEPNAYGDQKYLDDMVSKFGNDISTGFPVTDLAPWNIGRDLVHLEGNEVFFQSQKALVFHFQGFKIANKFFVDLYAGNMRLSRSLKRHVFSKYRAEMKSSYNDLCSISSFRLSSHYSLLYFIKCIALSLLGRHNISWW